MLSNLFKEFKDGIPTGKIIPRGKKQSSDKKFIELGMYPIIDNPPTFDINTQALSFVWNDDLIKKTCTKVYTVSDMTKEELNPVPQQITMRQARLALAQSGLLATVNDAIANSTDEALQIEWEYATQIRREWQSLIIMTTALGMDSSSLDDLFILGATL